MRTPKSIRRISAYRLPRTLRYVFLPAAVVAVFFGAGAAVRMSQALSPHTAAATAVTTTHKPAAHVSSQKPAAQKPATVPKPTASTKSAPATNPPPAAKSTPPPPPAASSAAAVAAAAASPGTTVSALTPVAPPSPPADPGATTPSPAPAPSPAPSVTQSYGSTNWSGYFADSGNYTSVSGSWTATSPTGVTGTVSADSTWIGIGGVSTSDLIQTGTENTVDASGQVSSAVFYELLPDDPIYPASITVSPGDSMHASINEHSPGLWSISITDVTSGQTFATTVNYSSSHSSVEWIQEDPSYASGGLVPLDHFGTAYFTASSFPVSGIKSITMVTGSGRVVAAPSAIGSDGASFSVTRKLGR